jgi:hypothetical protein
MFVNKFYISLKRKFEMNKRVNKYALVLVTAITGLLATTVANATAILCQDITVNHMYMDDSQVTACVDAGVGNINGNVLTDNFLTSGGTAAGYFDAGVTATFTQSGTTGTWSVASGVDAIGFKFGTGDQPDEWFIFDLVAGVTSGSWDFVNVFGKGGGLSHLQAYCKDGDCDTTVPEPGIAALLGIGLLGMAVVSRRTKV